MDVSEDTEEEEEEEEEVKTSEGMALDGDEEEDEEAEESLSGMKSTTASLPTAFPGTEVEMTDGEPVLPSDASRCRPTLDLAITWAPLTMRGGAVWPSPKLRPLMMTPAPAPERSGLPLRSSDWEPARRFAEPLRMSWLRASECTADREMMGAAAEAASSGLTGASSMASSSLLWFPSDSLGLKSKRLGSNHYILYITS